MSNQFFDGVMETVVARNPGEEEFHQAVREVAESVALIIDRHPEFAKAKVFERMVEPERQVSNPKVGFCHSQGYATLGIHGTCVLAVD